MKRTCVMCGDVVSILNRLCLCVFFFVSFRLTLSLMVAFIFRRIFFCFEYVCVCVRVLFVDLLCLSRLWLKWLSIGECCTEFQIRDNIRDEWEVPRARSQYLANLRKIYTRRKQRDKIKPSEQQQQQKNSVDKCKQQNKMTIQWCA